MTPEQSKIFDEYDRLFASEGWKMFLDDIRRNQESLTQIVMAPQSTEKDLWFCKGRNDVYQTILGLPALVEQLRKMAEQDDDVEADII